MCGITGLWTTAGDASTAPAVADRMLDAIRYRGPDDRGQWTDGEGSPVLAQCRLAIVDLSAAGHQPMSSAGGRYVLVFNGEIYNHGELRAELDRESAPREWRGHSDTETLLAAVEQWGLQEALCRCVGMFALALWDRQDRSLHLARDRFGEKPLYYGWAGRSFIFASELKAFRAHPGFSASVSRKALEEYLRFAYVPAPYSIYEAAFKLEPGCILSIRGRPPEHAPTDLPSAPYASGSMTIERWWSLAATVESASGHRLQSEGEALELLESRLSEAVKQQSLADVPLGAFLSGGVDSSLIVALMQRQSTRKIKTFTIGFEDAGFDESPYASAVAAHLGTDHHVMRVTAQEARDVIPLLSSMYDEPFADSSQIPTHLVCRAARQQVTVALSGDAGDELFGGYNRYLWGPRVWRQVGWLPHYARQTLGTGMRLAASASEHLPRSLAAVQRPAEKVQKLATAMDGARSLSDLYDNLVSCWNKPGTVMASDGFDAAKSVRGQRFAMPDIDDPRERMMFQDAMTYLPDDILCKVDRAAMAISLETRVPFLDHRVAEVAWRLPMSMKIRAGETKWALRQILYREVPRELIERPKSGFSIPLADWLRGPLREWAEELLHADRVARDGFFDADLIQSTWRQHLSGKFDWSQRLWCILMFQAWLTSNVGELAPEVCA